MKIVKTFRLKIVIFTALKIHCMLHGRVFVMGTKVQLQKKKDNEAQNILEVKE